MRPSTFLDKSKEMLDTTLFAIPEGAYVHNPSLEIPEGSTEQKEEKPEEKPEAETPAEEAKEVKETPVEEKEYKNPHGYIRRLERDRAILEERSTQLLQLVENLTAAQKKEAQESASEAEASGEEPDPDVDPFGAVFYQLRQLKKELKEISKKEEVDDNKVKFEKAMAAADSMVAEVAKEDPKQYGAALVHLGRIVLENIADENPQLTEKQIIQLAEATIIKKKLEWLASGRNPGIEFLKLSRRYGFRWEGEQPEGEDPGKRAVAAAKSAKEQIKDEKKTATKTRTIPAGGGVPPQTGRELGRMSTTEFRRYVEDKQKSGQLSGRKGSVPLREILAGKELK